MFDLTNRRSTGTKRSSTTPYFATTSATFPSETMADSASETGSLTRNGKQCVACSMRRVLWIIIFALSIGAMAQAAAPPKRANPAGLKVHRSGGTGLASFVTAADGGAIPLQRAGGGAIQPMDFFHEQGQLFGVTDPTNQLVQAKADTDRFGFTHTTFEQFHKGVRVFGGVLKVHQDGAGAVMAANGDFYPIPPTLNTNPTLNAAKAATHARTRTPGSRVEVETSELVIVDPGWYGDPRIGAHLAYYIILTGTDVALREAFFVDAHNGQILDQWTLLESALFRLIYDDDFGGYVRFEGDPPTGDPEVDRIYDYSGDTYDYWFRSFGRDSHDGFGGDMDATANLIDDSCPNAFGGGGFAFFCIGTSTDDIVAHEWGHSLINFTANLIYQNQSGQLNESYCDVWGEIVDLLNGNAAFPGPPGGTPWPTTHPSGPGTDTPNTLRAAECIPQGPVVVINTPEEIAGDYDAGPAVFGAPLSPAGITGDVAAAEPALACTAITNFEQIAGKIALVDRADCNFTVKVKNCQDAGAIAVIVANNVEGPPITMGGTDGSVTIPSAFVTQTDGATIRASVEGAGTVNATLKFLEPNNYRWLIGEDSSAFGGAIRDMWEPSCGGDPDRANSPLQTCNPMDNGGVHSGSGIPNHAFAILVDGKTFNGYTVSAIGPFKAGAVWYRAMAVYLTVNSDFGDAYVALNAAAADLVAVGTVVDPRDLSLIPFTADDAIQVNKALLATEMNTAGACGQSDCDFDFECDDFIFCNGAEWCNPATDRCEVDLDPVCVDLSPCTIDTCDEELGCIFDGTGVMDSCDDLNECTFDDTCEGDQAGTCAGTFHCLLHGDVFPPGPPQGDCVVDIDDILLLLAAFSDVDGCVNFPGTNLFPCDQECLLGVVDIDDILGVLRSFSADYDCDHPCPLTKR